MLNNESSGQPTRELPDRLKYEWLCFTPHNGLTDFSNSGVGSFEILPLVDVLISHLKKCIHNVIYVKVCKYNQEIVPKALHVKSS